MIDVAKLADILGPFRKSKTPGGTVTDYHALSVEQRDEAATALRLLVAECKAWRAGDDSCVWRCDCQSHARKMRPTTDAALILETKP